MAIINLQVNVKNIPFHLLSSYCRAIILYKFKSLKTFEIGVGGGQEGFVVGALPPCPPLATALVLYSVHYCSIYNVTTEYSWFSIFHGFILNFTRVSKFCVSCICVLAAIIVVYVVSRINKICYVCVCIFVYQYIFLFFLVYFVYYFVY